MHVGQLQHFQRRFWRRWKFNLFARRLSSWNFNVFPFEKRPDLRVREAVGKKQVANGFRTRPDAPHDGQKFRLEELDRAEADVFVEDAEAPADALQRPNEGGSAALAANKRQKRLDAGFASDALRREIIAKSRSGAEIRNGRRRSETEKKEESVAGFAKSRLKATLELFFESAI